MSGVSACRLEHIRLHNFRNYGELEVDFDPGVNVVTGRNAQGKTNLVEAIACLALTRSPRASAVSELMQWESCDSVVRGRVVRPAGPIDLELRLHRDDPQARATRTMRIDGKPRHGRDALGLCPVVAFSPDDLQLVKAGPDGRRRRLDMVLAQLDRGLAAQMLRYRRSVEQRNALLRHGRVMGIDLAMLEGFTNELVEHGARIRAARVALVAALSIELGAALRELSGGEVASLEYIGASSAEAGDAATELREQLGRARDEELARGVSLVGPHRDDVDIVLDGRPARSTASQGQQRSIVLALALAEARYMHTSLGLRPLVLFDDVLSELDRERRVQLLTTLAATDGGQVFVTTSEPDVADQLGVAPGRHFVVVNGQVTIAAAAA